MSVSSFVLWLEVCLLYFLVLMCMQIGTPAHILPVEGRNSFLQEILGHLASVLAWSIFLLRGCAIMAGTSNMT